ncbi:hypothetical protein HMPREF9696_02349 [Afipia clevelandensis ATCC 49720]|uniref:Uncharacterized protein n=1 Tax=Afipia clevelandensis ATCC 49720 TaxID=883079 RepID=K8NXL1_9BRAD|nr:hypothetical protein HMPREF9696_02349 [Afipia clevelandensis ATCC 49720]
MAGLVPAIHASNGASCKGYVDTRHKAGHDEQAYASPTVSNIAASMASAAVLPAQTTNCSAG